MTNQEQTDYWLQFHRFHAKQENIYAPKFQRAIKQQIKQFTSVGTMMAITIEPVYAELQELYSTVPATWAARSTREIRAEARTLKERHTMGFSERIIELMRQYYEIDLLNMADDITDTTKSTIQAILTRQSAEGFGFDEVVKLLTDINFHPHRGRLIARTETVAAANAASNIAAKETGLLMDKIWISARDNRTRLHHQEVNQSVVGMDDSFTVGGIAMSFPGDKRGGPSEVCNCRCTHAFIPKRDGRGRLIRV